MNIPERLKIGPYYYTLSEAVTPLILNGLECSALINCENLEILYVGYMDEQKTAQSIYHEVIHGIEEGKFIDYPSMNPEEITDRMALGVLEFIWDNEEFIAYTMSIREEDNL